jgi:chromosome segregation ATPase
MESLSPIIEALVTAFAGGFTGWVFARKKMKAEAQKSELDTIEQAVTIWRNLAEELETKLEAYRVEIEKLRSDIEKLRNGNRELQEELKKFQKQTID